jgi:peptide deformylase
MANLLPILTHPAPQLRLQSRPLTTADIHDPRLIELFQNMITTMYADDGIGLAAPQVGEQLRVITIGKDALNDQKNFPLPIEDLILINPEIESYSVKTAWDDEGCLSVPGIIGEVSRHTKVKVHALLPSGVATTFEAIDFFARVLQHEIDHLNGILFIDRARNIQKKVRDTML